jgi:hypothetical protein
VHEWGTSQQQKPFLLTIYDDMAAFRALAGPEQHKFLASSKRAATIN